MANDPYVNYLQYHHYPDMSSSDLSTKLKDQPYMDAANSHFQQRYPNEDPYTAPLPKPEVFDNSDTKALVGKQAVKGVMTGSKIGSSVGGAIGSIIPGAGTAAGAAVGTLIGTGVGAIAGAASGWAKGSKLKRESEKEMSEYKAVEAKRDQEVKERDYTNTMQTKQSEYMRTLSSGRLH